MWLGVDQQWWLIWLQSCATGLNADGKAPKGLVEEMVPLLDSREVV